MLALIALLALLASLAALDAQAGRLCLESLAPLIIAMREAGRAVAIWAIEHELWITLPPALVLALLAVERKGRLRGRLLAAALSILAFTAAGSCAAAWALLSAAASLAAFLRARRSPDELTEEPAAERRYDLLAWASIALAAAVRLYALNRYPAGFSDEVAFPMASALHHRTLAANALRISPGYVSQGLCWSAALWLLHLFVPTSIVSVRLLWTILGLFVLILYYWTVRSLFGRGVAFWSLLFLAFGPVDHGAMRQELGFGYAHLFILPLCLLSQRLARRALAPASFVALLILCAALAFCYPPGMLFAGLPLAVLACARSGLAGRASQAVSGLAVWFVAPTLACFALMGRRVFVPTLVAEQSGSSLSDLSLARLADGARLICQAIMGTGAPLWDGFLAISGSSGSAALIPVGAALLPLGFGALALARRESKLILAAWLIAAAAPALASALLPGNLARRSIFLLSGLDVVAGLGAFALIRELASAAGCSGAQRRAFETLAALAALLILPIVHAGGLFGGSFELPREQRIADALAPILERDSIYFFDLGNSQLYLLYDEFAETGGPAWRDGRVGTGSQEAWRAWESAVEHALPTFEEYAYVFTGLELRRAEIEARSWRRIVFVFARDRHYGRRLEILKARYPELAEKSVAPAGCAQASCQIVLASAELPAP